ncbi:hypothetical protein HYO44_20645 [Vibrio parahaemolyticus]|nr:hypothetical protein [Vibrio parahaemolyticus]
MYQFLRVVYFVLKRPLVVMIFIVGVWISGCASDEGVRLKKLSTLVSELVAQTDNMVSKETQLLLAKAEGRVVFVKLQTRMNGQALIEHITKTQCADANVYQFLSSGGWYEVEVLDRQRVLKVSARIDAYRCLSLFI